MKTCPRAAGLDFFHGIKIGELWPPIKSKKKLLGLPFLDIREFNGDFIVSHSRAIPLSYLDPDSIRDEDIISTRMTFALRYILGMKNNASSSIYVVDGKIVSYKDIFYSDEVTEERKLGKISDKDCCKWFKDGSSHHCRNKL